MNFGMNYFDEVDFMYLYKVVRPIPNLRAATDFDTP